MREGTMEKEIKSCYLRCNNRYGGTETHLSAAGKITHGHVVVTVAASQDQRKKKTYEAVGDRWKMTTLCRKL